LAPLLRKIRQERWYAAKSSPDEPLPADPLSDLNTRDDALSVWQVLANDANLEDIVVALAATFGRVQNIDVVVIDEQAIRDIGIEVQPTQGHTPLAQAIGFHRELVRLRAQNLVDIGGAIREAGVFREFSAKEVAELLARYIQEARLKTTELQPSVRSHLEDRDLI